MKHQENAFAGPEADRWFERNASALRKTFDPRRDWPMRLMELYGLKPKSVLEIGAASGARMDAIHRRYGCRAVAAEPSAKAVADGRSRFQNVEFVRGLAHDLPLKERFDLVICYFVLHWVDRRRLLESAAEVDRLIADGGYLILGDFWPSRPSKVPYHHLPASEIYTYKQNYPALFTASALYREVGIFTGDHDGLTVSADAAEDDRIAVSLLRKEFDAAYALRNLPQ